MALKVYTHGRRDQMKVALTFDDGPNPPRTDQIMEILESRAARGTFFVIGKWVERFPQAFKRIPDRWHLAGNHSYSHQAHIGDYDRAEAVITNLSGRPSEFLRAPYGNHFTCLYSPLALSPEIKIVSSDVNPSDFDKTDPREIVEATLNHPALAGGSIINLHDGSETDDDGLRLARARPTLEALPLIIDGLKARGFELARLDEMELVDPVTWRPDGCGAIHGG